MMTWWAWLLLAYALTVWTEENIDPIRKDLDDAKEEIEDLKRRRL
jgi:hypothetical protein